MQLLPAFQDLAMMLWTTNSGTLASVDPLGAGMLASPALWIRRRRRWEE